MGWHGPAYSTPTGATGACGSLRDVDRLGFIRQFARAPIRTGAVAPSSSRLAQAMTDAARLDEAGTVLELGPGTGIVTEKILEELPNGARFLALEINPEFAAATRRRCPAARVEVDDAANARQHLEAMGVEHCDAVLSGLPWAAFSATRQDELLHAIHDVLRPGGRFVTFAYLQGLVLPPARRFERSLRRNFGTVRTTPIIWRNLPPAFAYVASR